MDGCKRKFYFKHFFLVHLLFKTVQIKPSFGKRHYVQDSIYYVYTILHVYNTLYIYLYFLSLQILFFEVWIDKEPLLSTLSLTQAIANFLQLCFVLNLKYRKVNTLILRVNFQICLKGVGLLARVFFISENALRLTKNSAIYTLVLR